MRIIHFSDIHLSKGFAPISRTQRLLESMTETLKAIDSERAIDLIIFSGDMLNQGGQSFDDISQGFKTFEETFLKRMLTKLNLPKSAFVFVPGNHDINRNLDNKFVEEGLEHQLVDQDKLDEYYSLPPFEGGGMNRIKPFKQFEKDYYGSCSDIVYYQSPFQSTIVKNIGTIKVGISLLNSVWRCWDSSKDKGRILLSVRQIADSYQNIKDCQIKIAVSHHDISWMNEFETLTLERNLTQKYDMFFCGHTHSLNTEYCIKPEGSMFRLTAPGILSANAYAGEKKYSNGFTVVDFNTDIGCLETQIYRQTEDLSFTKDMNHGTNGIWHIEIPAGEEIKKHRDLQNIILGMKEEVDTLNQNLLSYNTPTTAPKALNKIFVLPDLTIKREVSNGLPSDDKYEDESISDLSYFVNSDENFIIYGIKESGKTILLDKLLLEILQNNTGERPIPALINFGTLREDVCSNIQEYWHQKRALASMILEENKVVLLIDNIDFSKENKMGFLTAFLKEHPKTRFIGTCLEKHQDDLVLDSYDYPYLDYQRVEIKQFGRR